MLAFVPLEQLLDLEAALNELETIGAVSVSGHWTQGFPTASGSDDDAAGAPMTTAICDQTAVDWGAGASTLMVIHHALHLKPPFPPAVLFNSFFPGEHRVLDRTW